MILTDVTQGHEGNDERLAFLFDTRRVKPSGLACELVLPQPPAGDGGPAAAVEQFARTPYAVSFQSGGETFVLVTLHVKWGQRPSDRVSELTAIAHWLADWARQERQWGHNLLALGDFNIDRRGDALFEAFTATGLSPPERLNDIPRTIFDQDAGHFYDQIAWFTHGRAALNLDFVNAGTFDFTNNLIPATTTNQLSWRVSDHYPLWSEFEVR